MPQSFRDTLHVWIEPDTFDGTGLFYPLEACPK